MLHAIIMAGGTGTRFWPASRNDSPKQMLELVGGESMIRQTVDRLGELVPAERRMVVTNRRLSDAMREQLPELPAASIVGEPCKRDTAPCIGLAALLVSRGDPDATMLVMPADHVIRPAEKFQAAIREAEALVDASPGRIVTFGIKPNYPAEIFGYIHRGKAIEIVERLRSRLCRQQLQREAICRGGPGVSRVGRVLLELRHLRLAAATIVDALRKHQPEMLEHLEAIVAAWDTPERDAVFDREFTAIKGISIDYAVMEQATDVAVIEAPFEWDDLGGWQSLARLAGTDVLGNTIVGRHLGLHTKGTIVRTNDEHLVVTLGLEDMIVVHTPNATLVASKHDEEQIRQVVKDLESRGWTEYL